MPLMGPEAPLTPGDVVINSFKMVSVRRGFRRTAALEITFTCYTG